MTIHHLLTRRAKVMFKKCRGTVGGTAHPPGGKTPLAASMRDSTHSYGNFNGETGNIW